MCSWGSFNCSGQNLDLWLGVMIERRAQSRAQDKGPLTWQLKMPLQDQVYSLEMVEGKDLCVHPHFPGSLCRPALCSFQRPLLRLAWITPAHPQACASTPEWSITKSFLSVQARNGFHILANCVQVGRILEPAGASMCACVCACLPACARMTCPQTWL